MMIIPFMIPEIWRRKFRKIKSANTLSKRDKFKRIIQRYNDLLNGVKDNPITPGKMIGACAKIIRKTYPRKKECRRAS